MTAKQRIRPSTGLCSVVIRSEASNVGTPTSSSPAQVSGPQPSFDERPDSVDADTQRISSQLIADMRVSAQACG